MGIIYNTQRPSKVHVKVTQWAWVAPISINKSVYINLTWIIKLGQFWKSSKTFDLYHYVSGLEKKWHIWAILSEGSRLFTKSNVGFCDDNIPVIRSGQILNSPEILSFQPLWQKFRKVSKILKVLGFLGSKGDITWHLILNQTRIWTHSRFWASS